MRINNLIKIFITILVLQYMPAEGYSGPEDDTTQVLLLEDINVKIDATHAINDLYNFKFDRAEMQFRWLKQKYPEHPISYFLLGLSEWWKIAVNVQNTEYDESFMIQIDSAIIYASRLYKKPIWKTEAAFFLAAGYGFKGRLYAERKSWGKAASAGRSALKYLKDCKDKGHLSPELMFGDALFNYFSVWISENYPILRPIVAMFPKGDKELGLEQLRTVATNAFYTRTEAQFWLMRILANEENDKPGAVQISEYLHSTYPDNAYFHRYYTRMLYATGQMSQTEMQSTEIIARIDSGYTGYEAYSGRYAAFYLGQINEGKRNYNQAKKYYLRAVEFAEMIDATDTGYYLYSLLGLGEMAMKEKDFNTAKRYFKLVRKKSKRKDSANKRARELLKKI